MMVMEGTVIDTPLQISEEKDNISYSEKIVPKLECKKYGFDCSFKTTDEEIGKIIKEFRQHMIHEHYIDYQEGVIRKLIRKN